jgi:CRP/FNR family cyclic AMP-dependent transcriptional regulator
VAEVSTLTEHPFLSGLEEALASTVAGFARARTFARGEYLFREGDAANRHASKPSRPGMSSVSPGCFLLLACTWMHARSMT